MSRLHASIDRALDLALPAMCPGCGVEGPPVCARCRPAIDARLELPAGTPLGLPDGPPDPLVQLEWCAPFAGVVRRALHELKYAGERRLALPLGAAIEARWARAGAGGEILVPVPVHAARRRERGYDQAELIAAAAAQRLSLPWCAAATRVRATIPQYRLDRRRRAANVEAVFAVRPELRGRIAGRWVILVDDVVTTGATLTSAARALLASDAVAVSAITVARER